MNRLILKAFDILEEALTKGPTLVYQDPNESYVLFTDTSNYVWSAVFTYKYTTGIDGKTVSHFHWTTLTMKAIVCTFQLRNYCYMWQMNT